VKPVRIVIHCSANSNGSLMTGEDIRRYHMAPLPPKGFDPKKATKEQLARYGRGWSDIGYHGVIEHDGGFYQGRPDNTLGAHVEGHNNGSLGYCLIGNDKFTVAQFNGLRWVCLKKMAAYNIPLSEIFGHYEFDTAKAQGKTCPNMTSEAIRGWVQTGDHRFIEPYLLLPAQK
jgi:N-acetylmuramoyl-L-alanine amidase